MTTTGTITLFATISILTAGALPVTQVAPAAVDESAAARTITSEVGQIIAGINAHDVRKATAFDASNIVSMECGRPTTTTLAAEQEGLGESFSHNPDWRVRKIDETVDVAKAGDMAVYRGTYHQDSSHAGAPTTQVVNFIAGFTRQADGSWKVAWSIVAPTEAMHAR